MFVYKRHGSGFTSLSLSVRLYEFKWRSRFYCLFESGKHLAHVSEHIRCFKRASTPFVVLCCHCIVLVIAVLIVNSSKNKFKDNSSRSDVAKTHAIDIRIELPLRLVD